VTAIYMPLEGGAGPTPDVTLRAGKFDMDSLYVGRDQQGGYGGLTAELIQCGLELSDLCLTHLFTHYHNIAVTIANRQPGLIAFKVVVESLAFIGQLLSGLRIGGLRDLYRGCVERHGRIRGYGVRGDLFRGAAAGCFFAVMDVASLIGPFIELIGCNGTSAEQGGEHQQ
jgi:hypothetical protein